MTTQQKNALAKIYFEIGELHGRTLSKETLITLVDSFADLNFDLVFKTMNEWLLNGLHFPLPAHIRQKIKPIIEDKDEVQESVNRILTAVSKFGYTNQEHAREYIGSLGWQIISGTGGWKNLCETLTNENLGIYRAQLRDYGHTVYKMSKTGNLNNAPELPQPAESLLPKLKMLE